MAFVADVFLGELNDRARLDCAPRADVMADASRGRAKRLTVVHVIRIDHGDRFLGAHFHNKLANLELLLGREAELLIGLWADGAVGVVPCVHHPEIDEFIEPFLTQEIVDVGLAQASSYAGE